jgi:tetratricopeptide (TPR) repeat protein
MKSLSIPWPSFRFLKVSHPSQSWRWLLVGVLTTSAILWISQVPLRSQSTQRASVPSQMASIRQEISFYQVRLHGQSSQSALDLSALASAYMAMARASGEQSWYLLAEQLAQQSLALLPFENEAALSVLARSAAARHDFAGALQYAAQMSDPKEEAAIQATSYLALGDLPSAERAAQVWVDQSLGMGAFTFQALVAIAQGDDAKALERFQSALAIEDGGEAATAAKTHTLMGRFYYERGDLVQAQMHYQTALDTLAGYAPALLNLAQLQIRQGHYRRAERLYQQVAKASDDRMSVYSPLVLRGQARLARLQGREAKAAELWQQAEIELLPTESQAYTFGHRRELAQLYLERSAPGDVAKALALMKTEAQLRQDSETLVLYAEALLRSGQAQSAQGVIEDAIATRIRDANLYDQAAQIAQALGQADQAQTYRQKTLEIDPDFHQSARPALNLGLGLGS